MAKASKSPRKLPKQERSSGLVEAIYGASVRIFTSGKKISTRAVAELAGVSVGSLYQYFPNKEALIGVLIEKQVQKHVQILKDEVAASPDASIEVAIEKVIHSLFKDVYQDRHFLRGLLPYTFQVDRLEAIADARKLAADFVADILMDYRVTEDREVAFKRAVMIMAAVGGFVEHMVFDKSEILSLDEFSSEVTMMVQNYCVMPVLNQKKSK